MATLLLDDDFSANFNAIATRLHHPSGVSYREYRKSLRPHFTVVWRDIALGYIGLALVTVTLIVMPTDVGWTLSLAALILAGISYGYIHQYLSLFMHEASHYNIASTRIANDRWANFFLGIIQGFSIEAYRLKHFDHHRDLGLPEDPENHYFRALDWRFFVLTLSGARTIIEIRQRLRKGRPAPSGKATPAALNWVVIAGGLLHGAITVGAFWAGFWQLGAAWAMGFLVWFPFFSMLRQILEHRDFAADNNLDFTKHPHGGITRIFGDGPVSNTFGSAGFNRHLLHHWDPLVSYTRLKELEAFLLQTEAGSIVRARQETYFSSFTKLLS